MNSGAKRTAGALLLALVALICNGCTPSRTPVLRHPALFSLHRQDCSGAPLSRAVGRINTASLYVLHFAPFGRPEQGWATYVPLVEAEIGTQCDAETGGFAGALARWQARNRLPPTGVMTVATFDAMKADWQNRRPFVQMRAEGVCPSPPSAGELATAMPDETYGGKVIEVRARALAAYRRLVADARKDQAAIAADPRLLTIFSAFRSPAYDDARCAREHNCQGVVRAACSAHRTGLAFDLVLNTAPGYAVDSSADANRLAMANGVAYRWLVANAARYGFVNYTFEPWHWEWTGEKP